MTDRIHSLTLVLDHDMRDDDVESLVNACRHFRGVISVTPNVSDPDVHVAEMRCRRLVVTELHAFTRKLLDIKD
jgi:hypothetical protein